MITKIVTKKNQYRDSVFLMVINERVRSLPGLEEIAVMMATENNKEIMGKVGFSGREVDSATPNDLLICIRAEGEELIEGAVLQIE